MKSKFLSSALRLLIAGGSILAIFFIAFVVQLPFADIIKLKTHYIASHYQAGQITYKMTKKRPKNWAPLGKINSVAARAIMLSEDSFFKQHNGIDMEQLKLALRDGLFAGKRMRGASTITQQVVKNLYLSHERSVFRKIKEVVLALYMEQHLGKARIFEIYLNIIEYGVGLYGISNASYWYFKKSPSQINAKEGAFLAMLLPSPKRYAESYRQKKLTAYAQKIIKSLLRKLVVAGVLSSEEYERELSEPITWEKTSSQI